MSLTNILLFLILVTLTTYLFIPWKNLQKPPTILIVYHFIFWFIGSSLLIFFLIKLNLITL
jgi:hypothetical protein